MNLFLTFHQYSSRWKKRIESIFPAAQRQQHGMTLRDGVDAMMNIQSNVIFDVERNCVVRFSPI